MPLLKLFVTSVSVTGPATIVTVRVTPSESSTFASLPLFALNALALVRLKEDPFSMVAEL